MKCRNLVLLACCGLFLLTISLAHFGCSALHYCLDVYLMKSIRDSSPPWGYIDRNNKLVINFNSDSGNKPYPMGEGAMGCFHNGLARVRIQTNIEQRFLFINREGDIVGRNYWVAGNFSEGLAAVAFSPSQGFGYIDKSDRWIIQPIYLRAREFKNGLAAVQDRETKLWGFVDRAGKLVVPCKFESVGDYSEGLAFCELKGKYGFLDKLGNLTLKPQYDLAWSFSEGLAAVETRLGAREKSTAGRTDSGKKDGGVAYKRAYIDHKGKVLFEFQDFRHASVIDMNDTSWIDGVIQPDVFTAELLTPVNRPDFPRLGSMVRANSPAEKMLETGKARRFTSLNGPEDPSFKEGLAVRHHNEFYGYIDKTGKFVLEPKFGFARPFSQRRAIVYGASPDVRCGAIDPTGKLMVPRIYQNLTNFVDGVSCGSKAVTNDFIQPDGSPLFPGDRKRVNGPFSEGLAPIGSPPAYL